MNIQRPMTIILLTLLLAVLAACGSNEESPAQAADPTPAVEEMEEPTEEPMEEPTEEPMEEPTEEPMEEPTEEPMEEAMMDEEMMMDVQSVIVSANPSDLSEDAVVSLMPDLSAQEAAFAGLSDVASIESIQLSSDGTAYITVDVAESTGGLLVIDQFVDSDGMLGSGSRSIMGDASGLTAPKGLYIAGDWIIVADFGASDIKVFDAAAEGNSAPAFIVTDLGADGRKVWDVYHDAHSDTLFASGTDGVVIVYNEFTVNQGVDGPDKMIIPANSNGEQISVNLHGISYYSPADTLILTDVGDAGSPTDGQIFTISSVSEAVDETAVDVHIYGEETQLGNPVDVEFDGQYVYVAEKSNDLILRYDNLLESMDMGPIMADASIAVPKAESIALSNTSFTGAGLSEEALAEMMAADVTSMTGAADLRIALTNLLGEHVLLASSATGAALDGRTADFEAAAASLDENSVALSEAITSVYGDEAGEAFLELWRTHIGFFVDYTNAVAAADEDARMTAMDDLSGYGQDFAAFLAGANPNVDADIVVDSLSEHVNTLTAVIDAQGAGDAQATHTNLRMAYGHMSGTANYLATTIGMQFPEQFDGNADSQAAGLRAALNSLLAEHTYLAAVATDAALGGRDAEFAAAAESLDNNSIDLAAAMGSVYGEEAQAVFLELWRSHIGYFVDYTMGAAADDQDMKDQAVDDLLGYRADFIAFLMGANPEMNEDGLTEILTPHVGTLTAVIDAQAAGSPEEAYPALRTAYAHMHMIADPLAEAIVMQFPESFQ